MAPMTLDEAKLIADCNRRLPGRASTGAPEATVVLAAALRESEARVEALTRDLASAEHRADTHFAAEAHELEKRALAAEAKIASARREAFEEVAKVALDAAKVSDEYSRDPRTRHYEYAWRLARDCERDLASSIRALAPKPPTEPLPFDESSVLHPDGFGGTDYPTEAEAEADFAAYSMPRGPEAPFDAPPATPPAETRPLDRALRAGMKAIVEAHPAGSPSCDEPLTAQQLHDIFAIMLEAGYSRLDGKDYVG